MHILSWLSSLRINHSQQLSVVLAFPLNNIGAIIRFMHDELSIVQLNILRLSLFISSLPVVA